MKSRSFRPGGLLEENDNNSQEGPGSWPRIGRWILVKGRKWGPMMTVLISMIGIVLRLTIKDRLPLLSTIFYATPLPLCGFFIVISAVIRWSERKWKRGVVYGVLGLSICVWAVLAGWMTGESTLQRTSDSRVFLARGDIKRVGKGQNVREE